MLRSELQRSFLKLGAGNYELINSRVQFGIWLINVRLDWKAGQEEADKRRRDADYKWREAMRDADLFDIPQPITEPTEPNKRPTAFQSMMQLWFLNVELPPLPRSTDVFDLTKERIIAEKDSDDEPLCDDEVSNGTLRLSEANDSDEAHSPDSSDTDSSSSSVTPPTRRKPAAKPAAKQAPRPPAVAAPKTPPSAVAPDVRPAKAAPKAVGQRGRKPAARRSRS